MLSDDGQPLLLSSLYQAPYSAVDILFKDRRTQMVTGHLSYSPEITGQANDKASWFRGLYNSLWTSHPVYCALAASKPEANRWGAASSDVEKWQLWLPRQADMEMVIDVAPKNPVAHNGQWPVVYDYANDLEPGKEYLIHASYASTGQPVPGSPIKFICTEANSSSLKWVPALMAVLNSHAWAKDVSITFPQENDPYRIRISNTSPDILFALDPEDVVLRVQRSTQR
ncbi:hypothetical protein [Pseudomonas sp. KNUC1026]|uniref:hypothetical protein n=1 Tax=Pseudomonas sp. KNUC1026 TaxID=2893890 RepID=UPI001F25F35A|nr:hypothetical protein [Pseudomonas sp. KNUC1026]UFH50969.1 hypothetical protein LN139_07815 [Pseudomonas sp. KNUC1026]